MSMQAASLEVLENANVPAPQARAIVQAIEIELGAAQDTLATKQDLTQTRHELELKIEVVRSDLLKHMYTAILAQTAVLLTTAYFFVTHLKL